MSDTVEVSRNVFEPIAMLVRDGLFKDEKDALKSLVLDQAAMKIRHFDSLIEEMRAKYEMSFEEKEQAASLPFQRQVRPCLQTANYLI